MVLFLPLGNYRYGQTSQYDMLNLVEYTSGSRSSCLTELQIIILHNFETSLWNPEYDKTWRPIRLLSSPRVTFINPFFGFLFDVRITRSAPLFDADVITGLGL
jgi:hypothetical protein